MHLVADQPDSDDDGPAMSIAAGLAAWAAGARPVIVRCGRPTYPVITPRWEPVGEFADDDLCRACYRTLHPDDQHRAFDHPQPTAA
ncbi:hypothetical protein [Kitasatospora fiedleri]|uniref:hypothetical protein n=1 Tax=Kitasatospora fiedleri TaxID=2991545 RepID=UPI00249BA6D3|nr:hypothetical protein [Kitasatospora fiedleri]